MITDVNTCTNCFRCQMAALRSQECATKSIVSFFMLGRLHISLYSHIFLYTLISIEYMYVCVLDLLQISQQKWIRETVADKQMIVLTF